MLSTIPGCSVDDPPDVVLLDVHMPRMDGYEVCARLRRDARTQAMPIIMLTASDDPALNQRAYRLGAQACVPKPFRREGLIATIEAVLANVNTERHLHPERAKDRSNDKRHHGRHVACRTASLFDLGDSLRLLPFAQVGLRVG